MRYILIVLQSIIFFSCANSNVVYWCGDHPCINKKERESYFKKTMIVETKTISKNKNDVSEIEKLTNEAKKEQKIILNEEKERVKEEKRLAKQAKLEEKERVKEEKRLAKQAKLEEKELAKRIKRDEKKITKKNQVNKNKTPKKIVKSGNNLGNLKIESNKFDEIVDKIVKRNSSRKYPDINDIPQE